MVTSIILCIQSIFQLVDGVLTQDSDTFLYGATVVYKDLTTLKKVGVYIQSPKIDDLVFLCAGFSCGLLFHD